MYTETEIFPPPARSSSAARGAPLIARLLVLLFASVAALALSGCKPSETPPAFKATGIVGADSGKTFKSTDISGIDSGKTFRLNDHTGQPRTLSDFKGKIVVLFFGYTQCPEACPNTLMELARAMKRLGPDAEKVQVLFVTLDPERDTPALLAQYVPTFHPGFIGLYGTPQQTVETAKEYRIFYNKVAGGAPDSYTIDHSLGTHIYDQSGKLRLLSSYGMGADDLAHDIKLLLAL